MKIKTRKMKKIIRKMKIHNLILITILIGRQMRLNQISLWKKLKLMEKFKKFIKNHICSIMDKNNKSHELFKVEYINLYEHIKFN